MKSIFHEGSYLRKNSAARFCICFFISIIISTTAYIWLRNSSLIEPFLDFNARSATHIWNLVGNSISAKGAVITSTDFKFRVTAECTSIGPTAILISAIVAWPSTFREKVYGILYGTASLFIINLIRMLTLFYIGYSFPNYLDLVHYYIWQAMIILLALGLWLFWIDKMIKSPPAEISDSQTHPT